MRQTRFEYTNRAVGKAVSRVDALIKIIQESCADTL